MEHIYFRATELLVGWVGWYLNGNTNFIRIADCRHHPASLLSVLNEQ